MSTNPTLTPLPEAITGNRWSVRNGPGAVDLTRNEMFVPTGNNAGEHFVRLHEMAHAKFTPKMESGKMAAKHGVSLEALQVCEDARIHAKLIQLGRDMAGRMSGMLNKEGAEKYVGFTLTQPNPGRELARILTGSLGTADHQRIVEAAQLAADILEREKKPEMAETIARTLDAVAALKRTAYSDNRRRRVGPAPLHFKKTTIPAAKLFDQLFPVIPPQHIPDKKLRDNRRQFERNKPGAVVPWAEMSGPLSPALSRNLTARKLGRMHRATDAGSTPRNLHRFLTDGAIFDTRKRITGGTLLLDASGSMGISAEKIQSFLDAVPHGKVAMYAGKDDRTHGTLVIIANRGRAVSEEQLERLREEIGHRNLVDGPALRWLAKQPGKKAWVSDGVVTGAGEKVGANLIDEVSEICTRNRIDRFDGIEAAIQDFKKKGGK